MRQENHRGYMLTILTVVYAFNFVDRNVLSLLMQAIKADLQLSDTQMGLLSGIAFAFFYSTLGIPIARWADYGNRISIISITTGVWSAMVICCGMATSFLQLLLARVGVAIGEAGCVPPAQSLIGDCYARSERTRAMSIYMLGAPLSVIIGFAFAGWLNEHFGWRMAFFVVGVPGLVLTLVVRFTLREPRLSQSRREPIPRGTFAFAGYVEAFRILWNQRAYRHLVVAFTVIYLFSFGVSQWVPAFLIRTFGIQTGELGLWYALIWGAGGLAGTYLGGHLATRHAADNERRQLTAMAAVLFAFVPLYLGIYLAPSTQLVFALMMVAALLFCAMFGPLYAMIQQVVAPNMRAMAVAIVLLSTNLIGMGLGPTAVGAVSDLLAPAWGNESLRMALVIWTPGYLWGAFHLLRARRYVQADIATAHADDPIAGRPALADRM